MPYDRYGSYYDEDEFDEDDEGVLFDMLPLIVAGVSKPKRIKFF